MGKSAQQTVIATVSRTPSLPRQAEIRESSEVLSFDPYEKVISMEGEMASLFVRYRDLFEKVRNEGKVCVGRERAIVVRGSHVLKFPLNEDGLVSNEYEAHYESEHVPLAACRIVLIEGLPVLEMEKVEPVTRFDGLPDWTGWVDCQQVGYTSDGRLVAYDL